MLQPALCSKGTCQQVGSRGRVNRAYLFPLSSDSFLLTAGLQSSWGDTLCSGPFLCGCSGCNNHCGVRPRIEGYRWGWIWSFSRILRTPYHGNKPPGYSSCSFPVPHWKINWGECGNMALKTGKHHLIAFLCSQVSCSWSSAVILLLGWDLFI